MAEMTTDPLVLKVMRLRRPQMLPPSPMLPLSISASGASTCIGSDVPKLLLPMSLTQSLVGESFAGYLHLGNHSSAPVNKVVLKVELQIGGRAFILFNNSSSPVESLAPGNFFDTNVEHELRDAGTYVLSCHISYTLPGALQEPGAFKRSYRFPALQPFAVVHRVVQLDSQLLVECSVENATSGNIYLTSWRLDCVDGFEACCLGMPGGRNTSACSASQVGGTARLLKPRGAHSIVFRVSSTDPELDAIRLKEVELVGTLALGWHVPDGPSGAVESHQIRMKAAAVPSLDMRVVSCPVRVHVEEPFEVEVEVVNRTASPTEPSILFDMRFMGGVRVRGATKISLGQLGPNDRKRVPLLLFVVVPGMHGLQGVALVDDLTRSRSEFGSLCDILAI